MAVILGLNAGHPDASACLVIDGNVVAAISEERLDRRLKYDPSFPKNAIKFVLETANISANQIDDVVLSRDPKSNRSAKYLYSLKNPLWAFSAWKRFRRRNQDITKQIEDFLLTEYKLHRRQYNVHYVEHHIAHIASAFFTKPLDDAALGVSFDGSGDFVSAMIAKCKGQTITPLKRMYLPDSLGHFYTAICQYIGFDFFGEEYKVMGLAPYGEASFVKQLETILINDGVSFPKINKKYIDVRKAMKSASFDTNGVVKIGTLFTPKLIEAFGQPRLRTEPITQKEKDLAKSAQIVFENAAVEIIKLGLREYPSKNLAIAGGCSLNGVLNAKIDRDFEFDNVFQHSASGDDGTAVGAALYICNKLYSGDKKIVAFTPFLGGEYGEKEIIKSLDKRNLQFKLIESEHEFLRTVAELICSGKVVGWFQGRSEWGPRALGNRSILASPLFKDMTNLINEKIKKRESFRPFAPSVLVEDAEKYFDQAPLSPYMMHVVKFKDEYKSLFPSVTHVDGTGRLQTVDKKINHRYYELLVQLKQLSGHGVVLNTSFNENEPVVETPDQAIAVFERTDIDALAMGNIIVERPDVNEG